MSNKKTDKDQWVDVKDGLPKEQSLCLVMNNRYGGAILQSMYHPSWNTWVLFDPDYRKTICLDVTHYIVITEPPRLTI